MQTCCRRPGPTNVRMGGSHPVVQSGAMTAGLRTPLASYAARLHAGAGEGHHVASPLGAWLLAALCAPVAAGTDAADELSAALGADPETARGWAAALLDSPHDAVPVGGGPVDPRRPMARAAAGRRRDRRPARPGVAGHAWADRHTLGLIKRFPVSVGPDVVLLLATALATKVSWHVPFDLAPGTRLAGWGVERVLATPEYGHYHESFVATTRAGDVAVHTARRPRGPRRHLRGGGAGRAGGRRDRGRVRHRRRAPALAVRPAAR